MSIHERKGGSMPFIRKHLNQGRTLRKPKRISKPKTQNPAFKKYKIVSNRRNHHPLTMMEKRNTTIIGYKLTTSDKSSNGRKKKSLSNNPNPRDSRTSSFFIRPEKAKMNELWLPNKMRSWKVSQKDKKKLSKELKKYKKSR